MDRFIASAEASGGLGLRAHLYELAILTPDPAVLATFYHEAMGYEFAECDGMRAGRSRDRRLRLTYGLANTIQYAAFALVDVSEVFALRDRVAASGHFATLERRHGWSGSVCVLRDPDGNTLLFGNPEGACEVDAPRLGGVDGLNARLQHVVFASVDIEAMLHFYRDVVGFGLSDRVVDEHGRLKTVFLRCNHEHHDLAVFAASSSRLDHWCHEADDWNAIRDWADHFARLDLPLQWGPGRHGPGNNLFLFIHDPDGNWIEISAELEHVQDDRRVGVWQHHERTLNSWGMGKMRA